METNVCGIFGAISTSGIDGDTVDILVRQAEQRGRDSSGLVIDTGTQYRVYRADTTIRKLLRTAPLAGTGTFAGHSRLVTNGTADNQPVVRDGMAVIHNGIIVNCDELWDSIPKSRQLQIDSEIIPALLSYRLDEGDSVEDAAAFVLQSSVGVVACAAMLPELGKLILFSNNGSLYVAEIAGGYIFSSEEFPLVKAGASGIRQIRDPEVFDIRTDENDISLSEARSRNSDLVPSLILSSSEEHQLEYNLPDLVRCTRCILPETMPFIEFNSEGVCNYCLNYRIRNHPRPKEELLELVQPYRREHGAEVIVPFSGGRDSCYALHLIVEELNLRPITYTYDWGMVTDVGRRNISRMCSKLGVENIIVAADISKKRDHIRRNLNAWLKKPDLGMLSILTAGDKHFFRHIESVKVQTGIDLNLWGINPLEVTHFKAGFLGVPPDFAEQRVYSHGAMKQLRYQSLRFRAMLKSPGYFNRSMWDTLSGEYYRSFAEKSDYFHVFDFWRWDEQEIDSTLLGNYGWEKARDTSTTWRIGDGTAAFYNYAYCTIAGFTEHDTFRSNQIREGDITRDQALELVAEENRPRYPNLKWYLDVVGVDFREAVEAINSVPKLY
ncbi:hypothetical protein [Dietzia sp. 111N12-1]|uniref:hypothetical protein n=1 Tax=Dietzia sp. 111N12-1 TaxID=1785156 RepID=UPI001C129FCD|nr:hypothetical protein [Dietzia sp. 111N12-1]